MTRQPSPNGLAASVRQRLLNLARFRKEEFQFVLTQYVLERLLYRLSQSKHRNRFVLKGAMLFQLWTGQMHRPTRDLDLLGHGSLGVTDASAVFRDICVHPVQEDGLRFDESTIDVGQVRDDEEYHGLRVKLHVFLATARIPVQIDVGIGDAVTPAPAEANYPTLLDFPMPRLRIYPREAVVAEKFQAMVMLGAINGRIKDFYDLWILARDFGFDGAILSRAIAATFERRQTDLPAKIPIGLTPEFWGDGTKWRAFLNRNRLDSLGAKLEGVVNLLRSFLLPPCNALRSRMPFELSWSPSGSWSQPSGV